jgi:hypothetical protein
MNINVVTVSIDGQDRDYDQLERHLLYCADEGRLPSPRYDPDVVARMQTYLESIDHLVRNGNKWELTTHGRVVVTALRERKK